MNNSMPEQKDQIKALIVELQAKADSLKVSNPQEYKRILTELVSALEAFNQDLKSALSS